MLNMRGYHRRQPGNPMGRFHPAFEPSTVWLTDLLEAMDEVATSAAKPSGADRKALADRLELPAMPFRTITDPACHPGLSSSTE